MHEEMHMTQMQFMNTGAREIVELIYCNSQEQVADIMTKPLKLEQFLKLRSMLGMVDASVIN